MDYLYTQPVLVVSGVSCTNEHISIYEDRNSIILLGVPIHTGACLHSLPHL